MRSLKPCHRLFVYFQRASKPSTAFNLSVFLMYRPIFPLKTWKLLEVSVIMNLSPVLPSTALIQNSAQNISATSCVRGLFGLGLFWF